MKHNLTFHWAGDNWIAIYEEAAPPPPPAPIDPQLQANAIIINAPNRSTALYHLKRDMGMAVKDAQMAVAAYEEIHGVKNSANALIEWAPNETAALYWLKKTLGMSDDKARKAIADYQPPGTSWESVETFVTGVVGLEQDAVVSCHKGDASGRIRADMLERLSGLRRWALRENYFHTKLVTIRVCKGWWQWREQTATWPAWKWAEASVSIVDFRSIVGKGKPPEFGSEALRRRGLPERWIQVASENRGFVLVNHREGGFRVRAVGGEGVQRVIPVLTLDEA